MAIPGVSVADAFAASNPGSMALNVSAGSGFITMGNLPGSGTHSISVSGSLAQINADLASLSYTAPSTGGVDSITIDVWDQAGIEATKGIGITVASSTPTAPSTSVIIAATDSHPTEMVSNTVITAAAGDHMIFIGGTGDTLNATGGTETVQAFQGGNKITTGAGNDSITFGGSGNTIDAGSGNNTLQDSGSNNTIIMPGSGKGFDDIFGYVLQNGDKLDFRNALANVAWTQSTIGNFLHVSTSGTSAVLSLSTTSGGAATPIAKLEGAGTVSLATVLAHAVL
jgi:Ca2+-binding RTX toxin-like protein